MHRLKWAHVALGLAGLLGNLHPSPLSGQGGQTSLQEFREVHLGMEFRIVIDTTVGGDAGQIARMAFDRVDSLDLVLSDWRPQSELSRLGRALPGDWHPISNDLATVLGLALDVAERTEGRFDPTVGPLTQLWRLERSTGVSPSDSARNEARSQVGWTHIDLDPARHRIRFDVSGMQLDLGGIAKGWILEQAAVVLRAYGQRRFLIEAGGDIVLGDAPNHRDGWHVRVVREQGDTVLPLHNVAVSTSGPSAQSIPAPDGGTASHVIDLASGRGSESALQVSVLGPDAAMTDALATALTLVPRSAWPSLLTHYGVALLAP